MSLSERFTSMRTAKWLIVAAVLAGLVAALRHNWLPRSSKQTAELTIDAAIEMSAPTGIGQLAGGFWEEGIVSWRQPDFIQKYTITSGGDLVVIDDTLNALSGVWTKTSYTSNVTFDPFVCASAGRDYFAFGGIDHSTNDIVIERWKLSPKIAIPGTPPTKVFVRTQIYRANLGESPVALGIDPDKRFLLLLIDQPATRQLYQMPMQASATPTLLYDAASQPVLSQAWALNPLQHAVLGRIWLVTGMTDTFNGETMILVDTNNDGLFEAPPIVDNHDNLVTSGVLDPSQILDHFVGP